MTTTLPGTHAPRSENGERQTFGDVLASEWMKLRTVRSTFYTLIAMTGAPACKRRWSYMA